MTSTYHVVENNFFLCNMLVVEGNAIIPSSFSGAFGFLVAENFFFAILAGYDIGEIPVAPKQNKNRVQFYKSWFNVYH